MITTQDVQARVEIEASEDNAKNFTLEFHTTSIEITRTKRRETGRAKVKGVISDVSGSERVENVITESTDLAFRRAISNTDTELSLSNFTEAFDATAGDTLTVYVKTDATSDAWAVDLTSDTDDDSEPEKKKLFTGEIVNVKQNEKGEFIFEAWDAERYLKNKRIKYDSNTPIRPEEVMKVILAEAFGYTKDNGEPKPDKIATSNNNVTPGPRTPFVETDAKRFKDNEKTVWRFGTNDKGLPLNRAVQDILDKTGTHAYVDRDGVFRVVGYPEHNDVVAPPITKYNGGDDNNNASRVIYSASGTVSRAGQSVAYTESRIESTAVTTIAPNNDSVGGEYKRDGNIKTEAELNQAANREGIKQQQQRDLGSMTVVGGLYIDIFDRVIPPDFDVGNGISARPMPSFKTGKKYEVDEVTYKLDAQSGFRTDVKMAEPIEDIADSIKPAGSGFKQFTKDKVKDNKNQGIIESLTSGTGFGITIPGLF